MDQQPDIDIELFVSQNLLCGESPLWDENKQMLYWTDALGDAVYAKNVTQSAVTVLLKGIQVSALALHENGGLVMAGRDGFFCLEESGIRKFTDSCGNIAVKNINELIADPVGRIFGGQEAFTEEAHYEPGYLFRIDPDGKIDIAEEGIHLSNGMGFSPDLRSFYLTDTIARTIYVFDYNIETGHIRSKRALIVLDKSEGLPDGMTVDKEGYLWVAKWFAGKIDRYTPGGELVRSVELPAAQVTSLTFGGRNYEDAFVTSASVLWETALAPDGHDFTTCRGGTIYRIKQMGSGKAEYKARI